MACFLLLSRAKMFMANFIIVASKFLPLSAIIFDRLQDHYETVQI